MGKAGTASVACLGFGALSQDARANVGDPAKTRDVPGGVTGKGPNLPAAIAMLYYTYGTNERASTMGGYSSADNSTFRMDSINYIIVSSGSPPVFRVVTTAAGPVQKKN